MAEAEKGLDLCDKFSYVPLKPEADKMKIEFRGIRIKAEAKKRNTNALTIKEEKQ